MAMAESSTPKIVLPHGGYRNLIAYRKSEAIYQGTVTEVAAANSFLLRKVRKSAEEDGTVQPNRRRRMRPIIRLFRHSVSWAFKGRSLTLAKKPKSAAPRLKSMGGRSAARGDAGCKTAANDNCGCTVPLSLFHPKCGRFRFRAHQQ